MDYLKVGILWLMLIKLTRANWICWLENGRVDTFSFFLQMNDLIKATYLYILQYGELMANFYRQNNFKSILRGATDK